MKEKGIIFNTEMVKVTLDGRKTATRRPVKHNQVFKSVYKDDIFQWDKSNETHPTEKELLSVCPFGQIRDRLYVRETWALCGAFDTTKATSIKKDWIEHQIKEGLIFYRADGEQNPGPTIGESINGRGRWRPSIHMPKWAARIWLEITDIRVERIQEITDSQALKEGVAWDGACPEGVSNGWCPGAFDSPRESFEYLWDSVYSNWDQNPWVWVIEFKVLNKELHQ